MESIKRQLITKIVVTIIAHPNRVHFFLFQSLFICEGTTPIGHTSIVKQRYLDILHTFYLYRYQNKLSCR